MYNSVTWCWVLACASTNGSTSERTSARTGLLTSSHNASVLDATSATNRLHNKSLSIRYCARNVAAQASSRPPLLALVALGLYSIGVLVRCNFSCLVALGSLLPVLPASPKTVRAALRIRAFLTPARFAFLRTFATFHALGRATPCLSRTRHSPLLLCPICHVHIFVPTRLQHQPALHYNAQQALRQTMAHPNACACVCVCAHM